MRSGEAQQGEGLKVTVPARAENATVIRHLVAGLGEAAGMDETGIADLKTVVTEACMNVVVHAYDDDGEAGPLEVAAWVDGDCVVAQVTDRGQGIRPQATSDRPTLRLGLSLVAALTSSFEIAANGEGGTTVTMRVPISSERGAQAAPSQGSQEVSAGQTRLVVERAELVGPLLSRVVGALAARNDMSVDDLSDAALLADAISEHAPDAYADGKVQVLLSEPADAGLEVRLGPMKEGAPEKIRSELRLPDAGGSLESLAKEMASEVGPEGEYLVIRFAVGVA